MSTQRTHKQLARDSYVLALVFETVGYFAYRVFHQSAISTYSDLIGLVMLLASGTHHAIAYAERRRAKSDKQRMVREMLDLLDEAGYDDSTKVSLHTELTGTQLSVFVSGEDHEAVDVVCGIVKVVFGEHGIDVDLADLQS